MVPYCTPYILLLYKLFLNVPEIIYYLYADDIIIISPAYNSRINNCIVELHNWMTTNYLYLNTNKTTLINISNNVFHFPTIYFENTA